MKKDSKQDVKVSVIDKQEIAELTEKKKRIEWVMKIIKEEGLENDKEFMKEVTDAIRESI